MDWIITLIIAVGTFTMVGIESGRKQALEEREEAERMAYYDPNKRPGKRKAILVKSYFRYN